MGSRTTCALHVTCKTMQVSSTCTIGSKMEAEDAPCTMEILQQHLRDMQVAVEKTDDVSSVRIHNRFLTDRETGVVSRFFKTHSPDTSETRQTEDEVWTGPRPHPPSRHPHTKSTCYLCHMSIRTCLLNTYTHSSRHTVISTVE
jgi:hypothetical protein